MCQVTRIKPDSELVANPAVDPAADPRPTTARITATVAVRKDGTVEDLSLTGDPSQRISDIITDSVKEWLFEPAHQGGSTAESKKTISLLLLCAQWPGRPETADCTLSPAAAFDRARQQKQ